MNSPSSISEHAANMLDLVPEAYVRLDSGFRYTFVNRATEQLLGKNRAELLGKVLWEVYPALIGTRFEENYRHVMAERTPVTFEDNYVPWQRWYAITATPDSDGGIVIRTVDITDRKRELRNALESISLVGVMLDLEGKITVCNDFLLVLTGWKREDVLGRNWFELFLPPEVRGEVRDMFLKTISAGELPVHYQNEIITREGERRLVDWNNILTRNADGQIAGVASIGEDITARRRAEEALRESEEKHRILLQETPDPFFSLTPECQYKYVNLAYAQTVGKPVEDIIGKTIWDVLPKQEADKRFPFLKQVLCTGEAKVIEVCVPRVDGDRYYVTTITPIKDTTGKVASLICSAKEITERKHAEEALRESEAKNREILDSIADGFFSLDDDMVVRYFNPAAERILNRKAAEVIGQRLFDAFPEAKGSVFEENYAHCIRTKTALSFEVDFAVAPYNNWYDVRVFPEKCGIAVFFQSITERKLAEKERERLQAQLAQAQKMESIGRLAGGVAHDFNNLLTIINGYSHLALRHAQPGDPQIESLTEILHAGERAAGLVRQLLAFSRKQVLQPEVLDVNATVKHMETMLRRLVGEDIEVVVKLDPSVPPILADRHQIEQVIMNLAANARDAMPGTGTLTLETRHLEKGGTCRICLGQVYPGAYVELTVRDTGIGMDEHTLQEAFEPFFTTKSVGKGTGLGLSMVQGVVIQSGGHVGLESEPGKGSAFHIYLPVAERPLAEPKALPDADVERGGETILLVEDEEAVRRFVGAILQNCGYRVVDAGDGEQGLRVCASEAVDLLVTDMVMPKMSGVELARRARLEHPGLRTLFISGYPEGTQERNWESVAGAKFLQKPFAPNALAAKVREVLDGR